MAGAAAVSHWAAGYIGRPWVAGQSDCWSFAREVWRDRFGFVVPAVSVDPRSPLGARRMAARAGSFEGWQAVETPAEGDGVLMARGAHPCHVGVWAAGAVLHSLEGAGVVLTRPGRLRDLGYRLVGYYRRAETCAPSA